MTRRSIYAAVSVALAFWGLALAAGVGCGPAGRGDGTPDNPFATAVAPPSVPPSVVVPTAVLPVGGDGVRGTGLPPPPTLTLMERQYQHLDSNLIRAIETHEAATADRGVSRTSEGAGQPEPTPELVTLSIQTDTSERVDALRRFLENNGAANITCGKGSRDDVIRGGCRADVPVSLLRGLGEHPGVIRIDEVRILWPASGIRLPASHRLVNDGHGVAAWRLDVADGGG